MTVKMGIVSDGEQFASGIQLNHLCLILAVVGIWQDSASLPCLILHINHFWYFFFFFEINSLYFSVL